MAPPPSSILYQASNIQYAKLQFSTLCPLNCSFLIANCSFLQSFPHSGAYDGAVVASSLSFSKPQTYQPAVCFRAFIPSLPLLSVKFFSISFRSCLLLSLYQALNAQYTYQPAVCIWPLFISTFLSLPLFFLYATFRMNRFCFLPCRPVPCPASTASWKCTKASVVIQRIGKTQVLRFRKRNDTTA